MELSTVFDSATLKAVDLQGHEPTVLIASIEKKAFDDGAKLVISFQGKKKALVCNKTNANRIASAYGTNTDNWIGKEITLFVDQVDFKGELVDAIRVRVKREAPVRPASADMMPADDF
jgi:hypothetical protein